VVRLRTKGEVINGELDVDLIKSWVTACTTNHNICKQKPSISELHTYVRPSFIDVITKTIVPDEKVTDYVALSYVWGPDKPGDYRTGTLLDTHSETRRTWSSVILIRLSKTLWNL
jgi:hypothetical protein